MTTTTTTENQSSNARARIRDNQLVWLLTRHPSTAGMVASIGLFPTRKKASKRLIRLARRGVIRFLGTVSLKDGRPEHVYGCGRWKRDNLQHEVLLTQVCFRIHATEIRRGAGDSDSDLRPDAELWINGKRFFLELDRGTMGYEEVVRKRFALYRASPDFALWVCSTPTRRDGLQRCAGMLRKTALFATLDDALRNPHDRIWVDVDGNVTALPRHSS